MRISLRALAVAVLGLLVLSALLAPVLATYDPALPSGPPLTRPGADHLLGTNDIGQDVWSQWVWGARASLLIATVVTLLSTALSWCVGLSAGLSAKGEAILVGVTDALAARSIREAAAAEPGLQSMVGVVELPERFVSGESGALVNAVNGRAALPSSGKSRASYRGVGNRPTLLSNAETFAQLAFLAMVGPEGYASAGIAAEPGTVLLTIGGTVTRPAVGGIPL